MGFDAWCEKLCLVMSAMNAAFAVWLGSSGLWAATVLHLLLAFVLLMYPKVKGDEEGGSGENW